MCEDEITNAQLISEKKCPINVVSFGRAFACNSILSLQISRVFDIMARDWSGGQSEWVGIIRQVIIQLLWLSAAALETQSYPV